MVDIDTPPGKSRRQRFRAFATRQPIIVMTLALLASIGALALSIRVGGGNADTGGTPYLFSKRPVVEFEGRILDAGTNQPVPDVFVIVNMRSYKSPSPYANGVSSCRRGSGVIRTDADGRYRFRWSWQEAGEPIPDDLSIDLKWYKPGYEIAQRPALIGGFSPWHANRFSLRPSTSALAARADLIQGMLGDNCDYRAKPDGWIDLQDAAYRELWSNYCAADGIGAGSYSYDGFELAGEPLLGLLQGRYVLLHPDMQYSEQSHALLPRRDALHGLMPSYPWRQEWHPPPSGLPDFTSEEKAKLCAYLAPARVASGDLQ